MEQKANPRLQARAQAEVRKGCVCQIHERNRLGKWFVTAIKIYPQSDSSNPVLKYARETYFLRGQTSHTASPQNDSRDKD